MRTTSWLCWCVFVWGRRNGQALGLWSDRTNVECVGNKVERKSMVVGSNSPSRHCPQKAVTVQAATAISNGQERSRASTSCMSILALIGGRGDCFEPLGAKLWIPLRVYRKRELPLYLTLWAVCHALRPVKQLLTVLWECLPRLEAAKAHNTNSSAGKRR